MKRNEFLDFVKGVLITLVAVGHATQYAMYQNKDFWEDPLFKAIYTFHMPLFMAVAGYVSFRGITTTTKLTVYIKKRLISYLIPIFAWATLFKVSVFLIKADASFKNLPFDIVRKALTDLWFLWALLASICLTVIAQTSGKYRPFVLFLIFCGTLLLPEISNIYLFKYTFPFFVLGFLAGNLPLQNLKKKFLIPIIILFAALSYGCFVFWSTEIYIYISKMTLSTKNMPNIVFRWLTGSVVSVFALSLMYLFSESTPVKLKRIFILMGRDSLYIYILQGYVFIAFERLSKCLFHSAPSAIIADFIAIFIGVSVAYTCWVTGSFLARHRLLALILFGKVYKTEQVTQADADTYRFHQQGSGGAA